MSTISVRHKSSETERVRLPNGDMYEMNVDDTHLIVCPHDECEYAKSCQTTWAAKNAKSTHWHDTTPSHSATIYKKPT